MGKIKNNIEIIWQETNFEWNEFGEQINDSDFEILKDSLDAKVIAVWRKTSLSEFIKKIIEAILEILQIQNHTDLIDDFISTIVLFNLIPLDVKIVFNDEKANQFLDLIHYVNGEDVIYKKDLDKYSNDNDLKKIIEYFQEKNLLSEKKDKYIINGSVLNKVSILK